MPNVVAIIGIRMASTRLYGKPLKPIEGKPIVGHLIDIFKSVREIDSIVLATSDKEENKVFLDYAKQQGLFCYIDIGHSEEDVLGRLIRTADIVKADYVVRATPEGPIRYQNTDKVIKRHLSTGADLTYTEKLPGGTNVEVISLSAMKRAYQLDEKYHCAMVTLCMNEHPDIFKIEIITPPKHLQRPELDLDVDTEGNLSAVREIFDNARRDKDGFVDVEDAIAYVDKHPRLARMLAEGRNPIEGRVWQ